MARSEMFTCQRVLNLMVFLGFMIHHMLRINISIAIVEMVVKNTTNTTSTAPRYHWNEEEKNDIFGYFFWGYLITQIPGGRLSEKFGTKIVVGTGLFIASILTLLTPLAPQLGLKWLVLLRFCLGAGIGVQWPSTHPLATKWVSSAGVATFLSHMTASSLGASITLPTCGYLITWFGWPSVFYVSGSIALLWTIFWFYLVYDSPEKHPRISTEERETLRRKISKESLVKKSPTPWKEIFKSVPVWAIIVGNTCSTAAFFFVSTQLPTYIHQVLHLNIRQNGWFSGLPYIVRYFISVSSSMLAAKIINSRRFSTTSVRKFLLAVHFLGMGCLFTTQAIWGCNTVISIVVFSTCMGLIGLATPGIYTNPVDIAPLYSGTVFGVSQVPVCMSGFLVTKIVGFFTKEKQEFQQWSYVFWMFVGISLFAASFCCAFVSGEKQTWGGNTNDNEIERLDNVDDKKCSL